jgi:hypothetical protein
MPRKPRRGRIYAHYDLLIAQKDRGDADAEVEIRRRVTTFARVARAVGFVPDAAATLEMLWAHRMVGKLQIDSAMATLYRDTRVRRMYTDTEFLTAPLAELCGIGKAHGECAAVDDGDGDSESEGSIIDLIDIDGLRIA